MINHKFNEWGCNVDDQEKQDKTTDEELKTISFDTSIQKAEQLKNKHNNTKSLRGHSYYDST